MSRMAVGCDVGGTAIKIVRLRGLRIARSREVATPRGATAKALIGLLAEVLEEMVSGSRSSTSAELSPSLHAEALPIGVALPGFLDSRRRSVEYSLNLPALNGVRLVARLERRLGYPMTLDVDSNAGAVGEARAGAGRGSRRVLYVTLGTGLGAALAVDGRPVRVSHHTVGHVAHLSLDDRGPRCSCGNRGCAEILLSAKGVASRAGLPRLRSRGTLPLYEAAVAGDAGALRAWNESGRLLGKLLGALATLFHPQTIVVGGGVAGASSFFLPAARRELGRNVPRFLRGKIDVVPSKLGRWAGAVGAALLAVGGEG